VPAQSGVCPVLDACRLLLALPATSSIHKLIPTAASRRLGGRTSHVMGSSCSRRLPPPTDTPWLLRARHVHVDPCATQPLTKWQRISERKGAFDQGAPPRPAAGAAGVGYHRTRTTTEDTRRRRNKVGDWMLLFLLGRNRNRTPLEPSWACTRKRKGRVPSKFRGRSLAARPLTGCRRRFR